MSIDLNTITDISEKGGIKNGQPQTSNRRLFMQLLVFGHVYEISEIKTTLKDAPFQAALYLDIQDPHAIGLLTFSENPDFFVTDLRDFLHKKPFSQLKQKSEYTMFGRTYSIGYEPDLERVLIDRPKERALNPEYSWVIWYPLRRKGSFQQLSPDEQKAILKEHGSIGFAFGEAELAHDIRLACFGLDPNDNDFIIGLVGKELHPLSAVVQTMRKTIQTSQYIEKMGPFFVGKTVFQKT